MPSVNQLLTGTAAWLHSKLHQKVNLPNENKDTVRPLYFQPRPKAQCTFLLLGHYLCMRQFRIRQEKHLSSGFQNSLLQSWLEKAINEQVLIQKTCFLRITLLEA